MSDNHSARQSEGGVAAAGLEDDLDEGIAVDRQPRTPSITRLGRYRLVREIASGGMATVNLAVAEGLDKLVALKIIHPHLAQEESFVRMFLDEARLASAISHRNVCNVFDFGETDGRYYIAMDYLAGQSLRDVLRRMRKTDLQMEPRRIAVYVAYMIAEACEGLHAAHELHGSDGRPLNVVHRDVSPHNLFVTYDGNVSVVDFGIARASDRIQSTASGVLKGKFSYMAPEQMRQLEVDRRADIWGLGVVLWESLTLQRLFVRASQADTVMSVMMDRVRPPTEVKPDLPKELDAIVLRALARTPAQRFATAREMGRELMRFCRESQVMVSPIEIEYLMERLFEKEIIESKQLMRKAKHSSLESGVWMEVTPSAFGRMPVRTGSGSGFVEKSLWSTGPAVDVFAEAPRQGTFAGAPSQAAPPAQPRSTAHPDETSRPPAERGLVRTASFALLGMLALGTGSYLALRPQQREVIVVPPIPHVVGASETTAAQPAQAVPPSGAVSAEKPGEPAAPPQPVEPAPAREEASGSSSSDGGSASHRAERRERRARMSAGASEAVAALPSHERTPPSRPADELPMRGAEPVPSAPLATEAREEPPAPPVASAPVAPPEPPPAPVRQAAPAPEAPRRAAEAPAPSAQKLEARAGLADLDVEGSLGSSVVARVLGRAMPALTSCYGESARAAGRNDFGPLPASLVIDENGAVRQLNVGRHSLPALPTCASNALKRLRSERIPDVGTVQVRFKVTFTP